MASSKPTWAVAATVDEHPALVKTFVAWHLWLGAREIYLYFDRPDDPAAAMFRDMAQVKVILCDQDYWQRNAQKRPVRHENRQIRNATRSYRKTEADWLLHIDADEFLWPTQTVGDHLAPLYPWIDAGVVPVAERFFVEGAEPVHVFQGVFRRPVKGAATEGITARGLTGHTVGKAFSRVGHGLTMSIHRPRHKTEDLKAAPVRGLSLLHFDGLTRLHWLSKLVRLANTETYQDGRPPSPHRRMQKDALLAAPSEAFALHDRLKILSDAQIAAIDADRLLLKADFDPSQALKAIFGETDLLQADALDAWLIDQKADALPQLASLS